MILIGNLLFYYSVLWRLPNFCICAKELSIQKVVKYKNAFNCVYLTPNIEPVGYFLDLLLNKSLIENRNLSISVDFSKWK